MNKELSWLKDIRLNHNMTHTQVATAINVSRAYYTRIENGTRGAKLDTKLAKKIADVLNFKKYKINWTKFYDDVPPQSRQSAVGE